MRPTIWLGLLLSFLGGCTGSSTDPQVEPPPSPVDLLKAASRVVVRNASLVVTMDSALGTGPLGTLENADVLFADGAIISVGKGLEAPDALELDASGRIVMPGFVDVHNHLWQSLIRGCGADKDVLGWLDECVYSMRRVALTEQETYAAVRLSIVDLIDTGVTTVLDNSHAFNVNFSRGNQRALAESGLRYVFAHCASGSRYPEHRTLKAELDAKWPMASFQVCSHPGTSSQTWLTNATALAKELNVPLNLHLCENIADREERQMESMQQARSFEAKLLVNHAIHLTNEEIALLATNNARVAHNPLSNMRLASGVINLPEMRAQGIKVGLGLDGGTNDMSDFFANMRAAVGLQRAKLLSASAYPSVPEVLRMATIGGAEVLDLQDVVGSLSPGKKADLIIIDPRAANFGPRWDWLNQLVFNGRPENVEYVFVNGQVRKAEGHVLDVSEVELRQEVDATVQRIKAVLQP